MFPNCFRRKIKDSNIYYCDTCKIYFNCLYTHFQSIEHYKMMGSGIKKTRIIKNNL